MINPSVRTSSWSCCISAAYDFFLDSTGKRQKTKQTFLCIYCTSTFFFSFVTAPWRGSLQPDNLRPLRNFPIDLGTIEILDRYCQMI